MEMLTLVSRVDFLGVLDGSWVLGQWRQQEEIENSHRKLDMPPLLSLNRLEKLK